MPYFTQTDLENALSVPIVKAVYDDNRDGTVDAGPIAACLAYGTAMCDSFLRKILTSSGEPVTLPLSSVPDEVKFAAVDFGVAYTARRRPDIVKAANEQPWTVFYDQAVAQMQRYVSAQQMIPRDTGTTATEGATIRGRDPDDDDLPEPRWKDMGDFS